MGIAVEFFEEAQKCNYVPVWPLNQLKYILHFILVFHAKP